MSLKGLLDTKVAVYRSTDLADKYGDAVGSPPSLVIPVMKCIFTTPLRLGDSDQGPGEAPTGHMIMLTTKNYVLRQGDVLQYISGTTLTHPMWKVMTMYRPKNKLGEYRVMPYKGKALP